MTLLRKLTVASAFVAGAAIVSQSAAAQDTVTVRKDTIIGVHQDTVVHTRQDTAVVTTTVTTPGMTPSAAGSMTLGRTLEQLPNYKTLVSLLRDTHLLETLNGGAKFTVFAPTDDAFSQLTPSQMQGLRSDPAQLKKILLNHVVSGSIDTREVLKLKTARTLEGSRIRFGFENGHPEVNDQPIVQPGILTRNGFIYGIAGVIGMSGMK